MARVCVTVTEAPSGEGKELDIAMDERFGRAEQFLILERDTGEVVTTMENSAKAASHGAGPAAASAIAQLEVREVISGRFGPKAIQALDALGIQTFLAPSGLTAGQAFTRFLEGKLESGKLREFR